MPELPEDGDHRPDRNWLFIIAGVLCLVLGARAVYVGIACLKQENALPFGDWFTGGF